MVSNPRLECLPRGDRFHWQWPRVAQPMGKIRARSGYLGGVTEFAGKIIIVSFKMAFPNS
jgi:hypothetical protein